MRVGLVTFGTDGDHRPYFALARALAARGHEAVLVAVEYVRARAEGLGIPFRSMGDYPESEMRALASELAEEPDQAKHPAIIMRHSLRHAAVLGRGAIEATRDVDVVVAHNLCFYGFVAAETNEKPLVSGHLFPVFIPSANALWTGTDLGRVLNRIAWAVGGSVVRSGSDPPLNEILASFGLPARKNLLLETAHSKDLNLVAVSPHVLPHDPRWDGRYLRTGYWFLDEPSEAVDPALASFVEAGDPPVVVGFGSMYGMDARALTTTVLEALGDRRAVLLAGWAGLGGEELPSTIHVTKYAPHEWLFSRAACAVHHGGAGTFAAAARAGCPSVVVHFLGDQRYWGMLAARRGVGPSPLAFATLRSAGLRRAIDAALTRETRERARALGEGIRAEDGAKVAAEAIERVLR